jgi:hypothetical protein
MGVEMNRARRVFLGLAVPAGLALLLPGAASLAGQGAPRQPFPRDPDPEPPKPDQRPLLKLNQKAIKKDVERLLQLAEELKKEVDKADTADVLSLPLLRKAEEIEKLAKHIKSLARG